MPITADFHLHSYFSGDSKEPMEEMIRQGIALGLKQMCFTEHNDFDFPATELDPPGKFELNTDAYQHELLRFREQYADKLQILFGVELGLQPHLAKRHVSYISSHDFDFVIASSHLCNGKDPYYPAFYEGRNEQEAYREYFSSISENIRAFSDFDVYGHLDYVVRYGPERDKKYSYAKYRDLIDEILCLLIEKGKGIEVNTGGLRAGLRDTNPCRDILRRYRELGGEIITVASDAHKKEDLAYRFDRAGEILHSCGFRYYTVFKNRKPTFIEL